VNYILIIIIIIYLLEKWHLKTNMFNEDTTEQDSKDNYTALTANNCMLSSSEICKWSEKNRFV